MIITTDRSRVQVTDPDSRTKLIDVDGFTEVPAAVAVPMGVIVNVAEIDPQLAGRCVALEVLTTSSDPPKPVAQNKPGEPVRWKTQITWRGEGPISRA